MEREARGKDDTRSDLNNMTHICCSRKLHLAGYISACREQQPAREVVDLSLRGRRIVPRSWCRTS